MASRSVRRKRGLLKKQQIAFDIALSNHARDIRETVKANLSKPIERNYYAGIKSSQTRLEEAGARSGGGYACRVDRSARPSKRWGA